MISVALMCHPTRAAFVDELSAQLPEARIVWDRHGDRWDTGRRSLLAHDPDADFHLVVQDDAIICRDLVAGLSRGIAALPDDSRPLVLYTGRVRPFSREVGRMVAAAKRRGSRWLDMPGPYWGVAVAVPTAHIASLVEYADTLTDVANYDKRIELYYRQRRTLCRYSIPSLVEHRPVAENPSTVAGRTANRQAFDFIGADASALALDWNPSPSITPRRRKKGPRKMAERKIAARRIYGTDRFGRRVLVVAKGQPLPAGYEVESTDVTPAKAAAKTPAKAPAKARAKPKRRKVAKK